MSQRTVYLVCYDISDPKRLRSVYQTMRGYGDHLQLSVFRCDLNESERVRMITELGDLLNHAEDQVLIVHLGPPDGFSATSMQTLGRPLTAPERHAVVV
ncbi:CRISPR-associated endonuclease Cas2 [Haliangium sp.]|uniref:CRISPR-associated endonuclease Cas2 n=1 Tax=Haliangium sp. TaxID=2663208 RepID=UPI003D123C07